MPRSGWVKLFAVTTVLSLALSWSGVRVMAAGEAAPLLAERLASGAPSLGQKALSPGRRLAFSWDQTYLYFAAAVQDESVDVQDDRTRDFAGSDRLVLLVSRESGPGNGRLGEQDFAFVFTPDSLYHRPLKTIYGFGGPDHPDFDLRTVSVSAVSTVSPPGYVVTGRVPWASLGIDPHPGITVGVAAVAFDVRPGATTTVTSLGGQPVGTGLGRHLLQPLVLGPQ